MSKPTEFNILDMTPGRLMIWLVIIILGGGIMMATITRPDDVKFVSDSDNKCELVSKVETGKRLYCGKACTTPEYRHVFKCPGRADMTVDWFDLGD
jgi:hypothetical protein